LPSFKERIADLRLKSAALMLAMKHPRTPWRAKASGALTLLYLLSPIDLIPDFIPVLGQLDDLIIVPFGIWLTVKLIPDGVWSECMAQAAEGNQNHEPHEKHETGRA
jgi:uncharacterized membrane protein YkvA (DUF1232 family)